MVAGDVVPGDAVVVDVVQDAQAGLVGAVDVELGVVRLSGLLVARGRPGVVAPAGRHLEHEEVVRASHQRRVWRKVGHLTFDGLLIQCVILQVMVGYSSLKLLTNTRGSYHNN